MQMTHNVKFSCTEQSKLTKKIKIKICNIDKTIGNIRCRMLEFEIRY